MFSVEARKQTIFRLCILIYSETIMGRIIQWAKTKYFKAILRLKYLVCVITLFNLNILTLLKINKNHNHIYWINVDILIRFDL